MQSVKKIIPSIYVLVVSVMLSVAIFAESPISRAKDIDYTDFEIIRNGDFEKYPKTRSWNTHYCFMGEDGKKDGNYGLQLYYPNPLSTGENYDNYAFQQLTIPSELDTATLRFDYRARHTYA